MLVGKRATFDQIQNELSNMNMGEFIRFTLDFALPLKKEKVLEIFKKVSPNHRDICYEKFKDILLKVFIEINKGNVKTLKAKL